MKYTPITPTVVPALRSALLSHYDREARPLPWRRDSDPYRVLVSEIMLQQTRVETVTGYYDPWLERFPTVTELAQADEDEVLKAWEGLGYYRRARNLHRAAQVIGERYDGALPSTYGALRALPGVGEYTAGAVASIAFGEAVPAVDGNVRRVLARLYDSDEPKPAWLRDTAGRLVDGTRPGDWNQALMELGATVCTPRAPKCDTCPLTTWCAAYANGTQLERPLPPAKRAIPQVTIVLAVIHKGGQLLLAKRPRDGLLAGMWAFPELPFGPRLSVGSVSLSESSAIAVSIAERLSLRPIGGPEALPECRHRFTHLSATYVPWSVEVGAEATPRVRDGRHLAGAEATDWVDPLNLGSRALPKAQQRVMESWLAHHAPEAL